MNASTIFSWITIAALSLIPLFFLPTTQDYYDTNKWLLLSVAAIAMVIYSIGRAAWRSKRIEVSLTPATLGLGCITATSFISLLFVSQNKIEALTSPFGPVTFTAITIVSLFGPSYLDKRAAAALRWSLYTATSLLSLIAVYQFFGMGKIMFPAVSYLADPLWTPTGSTVATASTMIIFLPLLLAEAFEAYRSDKEAHLAFLIIMTVTVLSGLGITLWQAIPRLAGSLLPFHDGWAIVVAILKNPQHMWTGIGAENFLTAFSAGRLVSYNVSPLWNIRFTTNANLLFHLATVYGLPGGVSCIFFMKSFITKNPDRALWVSLLLGVIALLVIPPNVTLLVTLTLLLQLASDRHTIFALHLPASPIARTGISGLAIMLVMGATYGLLRFYGAELTFYQSLQAAKSNNGTLAYTLQASAVAQNSAITRFHITYAQTNLALATALAAGINQKDPPLTPEEITKNRQLIAQLIQQTISESKLAVKLNPDNILAWENLARTYAQLTSVATGADDWTITSFKQALLLDPNNPALHLELGTIYVQLSNHTEAITQFQKSISLKADYANAYYNLARVYESAGDIQAAISTLKRALTRIDRASTEYQTISRQLDTLKTGPPASP